MGAGGVNPLGSSRLRHGTACPHHQPSQWNLSRFVVRESDSAWARQPIMAVFAVSVFISKSLMTCFLSPSNTNVDDGKPLLYILNMKYIYICQKKMIYSFCFCSIEQICSYVVHGDACDELSVLTSWVQRLNSGCFLYFPAVCCPHSHSPAFSTHKIFYVIG